ncbi:PhzF family phenazine biosynthesis protein [Labrys monachus]|uniref:Trans-2,3-dihydro-3-hydroxyanthranilate isomerase n=1 Tax=Labrys monachus TaxID=217067 RepID=A0ABU0FKS6_9HYPH|nr:PhzF family phenazine biosynthesis protein [Labrys monachus]MDQ0395212.1 trans-2,3-dihydro-3-hydroxyanthranilate isomerase [Labrys monachus]
MSRRFFTLDVFADRPLAGNPLAVVLDAGGLDGDAMQKIAREFNLSETVFVLPPEEARHRARIRIFTPGLELPFAGHPTVGTAVLLASLDHDHQPGDYLFGLEEQIGVVPCAVSLAGGAPYARFEVPVLPTERGTPADIALIAGALGLAADDIGFENHKPTLFGTGSPFTFVPLRSLEAAARIRINTALWQDAFGQDGLGAAYVYTRQTAQPTSTFHARMFSPGDGIPEDPATGSAAASLSGVIARFDDLADGVHHFRIEQGFEMGRPSLIDLNMTTEGMRLAAASIGGNAVIVSEGTLNV